MKRKMLPTIGIIIVAIILITINEFTELNFIKEYAFLFIVTGMLLGIVLTKIGDK